MPVEPIRDNDALASGQTVPNDRPDTSQPQASGESSQAPSASPVVRFRYVRDHRRGGLGVVTVAIDNELGREVALKRIRPDKAFESAYRDKFLREARITGNLEHPGVVPVYGMGTDAVGTLFYAMRLIRGDTLAQLIQTHWRTTIPGTDAFYDSRMIQLLDHFLAVCQTMNYAHRRGVLHRDLKPDNIMVGSYGETLVVDWGLAKVINEPGDASRSGPLTEQPPELPADASASATRFGSAMGTPAYAPPELIRGQILDIDERTDIYGLGAILYELLTGVAPVTGKSADELKAKAADGQVNDLRRTAPYVPSPLAAICMKCLQANRADRYQSVAELIKDVQNWKADQPIVALPDTWWQSRLRWLRHHRGFARSGAAALAGAACVAMVAGVMLYRQRDAYADLARVNGELAAREAAQNRTAQAVRDLMVETFRSPDPRMDGTSIRVVDLLDRTAVELTSEHMPDLRTRAAMELAIGKSYLGLGRPDQAVLLLRRAMKHYEEIVAEDYARGIDIASEDYHRCVIALAEALRAAGALDDARDLLEKAISDLKRSQQRPSLVLKAICELAETNLLAGRLDMASDQFAEAMRLATESAAAETLPRPYDRLADDQQTTEAIMLTAQEGIARCRIAQSKYDVAADGLRSVQRKRTELLGAEHPDTLRTRVALAKVLLEQKHPEQAAAIYEDLLKVQRSRLSKQHPETLITQNDLALTYRLLLRFDEATELLRQTHASWVQQLGLGHPDTLVTANNLAECYEITGRYDDAVSLLTSTIEQMSLRLDDDHPSLLLARYNLARVWESSGQYDNAEQALRSLLPVRIKKLGDEHIDTLRTKLALGSVLAAKGSFTESKQLLEQSLTQLASHQSSSETIEMLMTRLLLASIAASEGTPRTRLPSWRN
ncbi:MAG: serine/threonine-protein kinase [Pirellulaceae bacterium]